MDNVTHTLVGLAAGELIQRSLPAESSDDDRSVRRRLLLIACAVASNFPDLDLVLSPLLPSPLGYLLHHRGHTHTVLFAIPQALLMMAVMILAWSRGRDLLKRSRLARKGFVVATLVGFTLHLSMDYLNSYGIHPFYPFDSRWFFGDMIFIIEPLFWVACGAPLVLMIEKSKVRSPLAALLIGLPALFAYEGFLAWYSVLAIAMTIALLVVLQRKYANGIASLVTGAMIMVIFIGVQSLSSGVAKRTLAESLAKDGSGFTLLDVATSPLPTNPFCWSFVSIERNESAATYRLNRGLLSTVSFIDTAACPLPLFREKDSVVKSTNVEIVDIHEGSLNDFKDAIRGSCHLNAWMKFARMPVIDDGTARDLRFSQRLRANFTDLRLAEFEGQPCPEGVPEWTPPRWDLMK